MWDVVLHNSLALYGRFAEVELGMFMKTQNPGVGHSS